MTKKTLEQLKKEVDDAWLVVTEAARLGLWDNPEGIAKNAGPSYDAYDLAYNAYHDAYDRHQKKENDL